MKAVRLLAVLALMALPAAGCGGGGSASGNPEAEGSGLVANAEGPGPQIDLPGGPPPKKLVVKNLKSGSGPQAKVGYDTTMRYVGVRWTGETYSNTWSAKPPPSFVLGAHELTMPGLDQGIRGMHVGGRREIVLPPSVRFEGGAGRGGSPASETLVYVVEVVKVKPKFKSLRILDRKRCILSHCVRSAKDSKHAGLLPPNSEITDGVGPARLVGNRGGPGPEVVIPKGPEPKKLIIVDLKEGSGTEAKPGDEVGLRYVGVRWKGGLQTNSWTFPNLPFFKLGTIQLSERGLEEGIRGMRVGGRREILIPAHRRYYKSVESPTSLNESIAYVVDLKAIKPRH